MMKRQRNDEEAIDTIDLANCLVFLSQYPIEISKTQKRFHPQEFECTTCNRKFPSFQALGGHRASHKKPKQEKKELKEEKSKTSLSLGNNNSNKPKMHECSICGQEFSLGQALGGHMRRHKLANNDYIEGFSSINNVVAKVPVLKRSSSTRVVMCLDLNLTPLQNDMKLLFGNMAPKVDSFF